MKMSLSKKKTFTLVFFGKMGDEAGPDVSGGSCKRLKGYVCVEDEYSLYSLALVKTT